MNVPRAEQNKLKIERRARLGSNHKMMVTKVYRTTLQKKKKKKKEIQNERHVWVSLRRESKHRGGDNQETGKMKLHIQRRKERRGKIKGTLFPRFPTSCQRYRLSQTVLSEKPRGTVARYAAPTTETAQRRKNNSSRLITSKTIKEPQKKGSRKRRWTVEGIETARIQTGLLRHYGEFTRVCSVCVCGLVLTGKRETNIASPATRPKPLVFSPTLKQPILARFLTTQVGDPRA